MNDEVELRPPDYDIIKLRDPMRFIDMVAAMNFIEANMHIDTAKVPVERTRIIFKRWLAVHDKSERSTAAEEILKAISTITDNMNDTYGEFEALDDIEKYVAQKQAALHQQRKGTTK